MKEYALALYEKALPPAEDLPALCLLARDGGFDRLELSIDETDGRLARLDWSERTQRELGLRSREEGCPIRTLCLSGHRKYPLGSRDPAVRARSLEILRKAIGFAADAGIGIIQLAGYDVYYEPGDESTRARFREGLDMGAVWAAEAGVILAFETMETPFMDTVEKAMTWVREIGSPWLGLYPDIYSSAGMQSLLFPLLRRNCRLPSRSDTQVQPGLPAAPEPPDRWILFSE